MEVEQVKPKLVVVNFESMHTANIITLERMVGIAWDDSPNNLVALIGPSTDMRSVNSAKAIAEAYNNVELYIEQLESLSENFKKSVKACEIFKDHNSNLLDFIKIISSRKPTEQEIIRHTESSFETLDKLRNL